MMPTIVFDNVKKKFGRGHFSDSMRDLIASSFSGLFGRNRLNDAGMAAQKDEFWALKDVSFEVRPGEALGIVGHNGSGKSTTLKLLARILKPDGGRILVKGRVGALIELAAGFHPDLTGRENVFLNASILGMGKEEINRKYDEIVDFAELHDFMDMPVKWYSSGMFARLGFAVAAHIDPEVLLIDEVLSVGDFQFRDKCIEKMKEFVESDVTMVVVSHDRHMIEKLCKKGILLKSGQVAAFGEIKDVLDKYYSGDLQEGRNKNAVSRREERKDKQRAPIEITGVRVLDAEGIERSTFLTAEGMRIQIAYRANERVEDPCFYSRIFSPGVTFGDGAALIHGTNSGRFEQKVRCEAGDEGMAEINYRNLNLLGGKYFVDVGIMPNYFSANVYDSIDKAVTLSISSGIEQGAGIAFIDHNWELAAKRAKEGAGR